MRARKGSHGLGRLLTCLRPCLEARRSSSPPVELVHAFLILRQELLPASPPVHPSRCCLELLHASRTPPRRLLLLPSLLPQW